MAVNTGYLDYVLEQLAGLGPVSAKRMFGGAGIYLNGVFFALIADDSLYFKVGDSNRADYEAADMAPFKPFGEDSYSMSYYEVPVEVMEDREQLHEWARKALDVAKAKKSKPKTAATKKRSTPRGK